MKKEIKDLENLLVECKKISIVTHFNPDGDAIGSSLALHHYLKSLNLLSNVITPNRHPSFLDWVPGINDIIIYDEDIEKSNEKLTDSDLIFTMDFNSLDRCGDLSSIINKENQKIVMIDHHQLPENYADINFSYPKISSTCEIVYFIIEASNNLKLIDKNIATCIYLGMMTDTGSFQYNGVNSKTHKIIAELINKGIIQSEIYNKVYNENSTSKLMILGKALNSLNVLKEYKTTYMYLKRDELKEHNYEKGDTEGVVNYGLSLKNIEFTAMFIEDLEDENLIKISFRSKNNFPCNKFAKDNFNGGGHINAAGGKFEGKIDNAIALFIKKIKEFKFH